MPFLDILAYLGATAISKVIEVAVAPTVATEVAITPTVATEVAITPTVATEVAVATNTPLEMAAPAPPKHNLAAIKAKAAAAGLKGPYEAPPVGLRRSARIAAKRDYIYKGHTPPTPYHIFGALFYNGYRTFSVSGPHAAKVALAALANDHYTVALHDCTLADPTITLKVGTSPDPHRLVTEKSPDLVKQYMVNAAGQKNGFYKEWHNGKLAVVKRYAANIEYSM